MKLIYFCSFFSKRNQILIEKNKRLQRGGSCVKNGYFLMFAGIPTWGYLWLIAFFIMISKMGKSSNFFFRSCFSIWFIILQLRIPQHWTRRKLKLIESYKEGLLPTKIQRNLNFWRVVSLSQCAFIHIHLYVYLLIKWIMTLEEKKEKYGNYSSFC